MASLSSLNFRLTANIAPFRKGLNKAERSMDEFGRKMQQTGKNLSMKLTAPLAALGAVSFNVFKGFEQEMSKVQAVSGATAEEFKALSQNAKDLGASTMFSAREVASLQTEFAKLGFSATEITKVTGATLALAQASGTDLARAAEVAGSTLRAFGLDASQTNVVTDVMAKSFSTSALDMETFAESMKYVAPVAKSAGMSIQETSAMLAIMADAGIKGSQAGTSLRRIISEIGASGKPTAEALKDLAAQGLNLADAKDEVGRSAQSALLVLAGGVDRIAPLTEEYKNAGGAAQEMADIMGNTAFGASKRLESAMEGLMISIGEIVAVAVVPLIEFLAKAASALNNMSDGAKRAIVIIAGIAAAIGPVIFILGSFQRALLLVRTATWLSTAATTAFGVAVQIATSPVTLIILAVAALAAGLVYLAYNFKTLKAIAINSIAGLVNAIIPYVNKLIGKFNAVAGLLGMNKLLVEPFEKMESVAVPAFKSLGQVVTEIKDDLGLLKEETEETKESLGTLPPVIEEITQSTSSATSGIKRMAEAFMELPRKATPALMQLKPAMVAMKQQMVDFGALAIQAGRAVSDVFAQSLRDAFGELQEGETRFGKFKESMIRMLRDMIIQFTAAAVAAFALAVAVRLSFGVGGLGGIKDIFGTMQSVAGFMPNIPMLAEGGVVTSPTLAMIGEGGQSEAVIPLDRLGEFGGGSQRVEVVGRISGADILLSNERASRNRTRQRGF
jgi:phage-related minor tail protein